MCHPFQKELGSNEHVTLSLVSVTDSVAASIPSFNDAEYLNRVLVGRVSTHVMRELVRLDYYKKKRLPNVTLLVMGISAH
jgi:hypothetical protein